MHRSKSPRTARPSRLLTTALASAGLLLLLGTPAAAQSHARASMAHRVEGEDVRAAIQIAIDPHWHLYHDDLGWPDAVGMPTTVELSGEGVEWGAVQFPEPDVLPQPGIGAGGSDTFINGHEGVIVLHAVGRVTGELSGLGASLSGLTCEDGGSCVPYSQEVTSKEGGADALFANFPEPVEDTGPVLGPADERGSGEANSTLYARVDGDVVHVALEIDITPDWHLYHTDLGAPDAVGKPTAVRLTGAGVTWGELVFPEPEESVQEGLGAKGGDTYILIHEGRIVVKGTGRALGEVDLSTLAAEIDGLTCDEGGFCIPYAETAYYRGPGADASYANMPDAPAVAVAIAGANLSSIESSGTAEAADSSEEGGKGLLAFLGLAVFWGLFTLLMPCTYPMIPITISYFTKQADKRGGSVLPLSLAYGAGIVLIFILIGVVVGPVIIKFATHPVTNLVIGGFFIFFAFVLFGMVNLQPPAALMNVAGKASQVGGYGGVFLMGATLVVTSFTCTAPFVGSLLGAGAAAGGVGRIALGMAVFGATMAIPFVFLSLVPGKLKTMPRSGEWMHTLKVFLGFVELAAALKFISNVDLVEGWGLLSREVFLLLWAGIALVAALYLFGFIRMKEESADGITPGRMVGALGVFLFSGYFGMGFLGFELDPVMTAIVPNYSTPRIASALGSGARSTAPAGPTIVKDDYDAAVAIARDEGKALLVNFTGHT
jgi:thiol:disulfide interchange protein